MTRTLLVLAGILGCSALMLDAYGTHIIPQVLLDTADDPDNLFDAFQTAVHYQGLHALLLGLIVVLLEKKKQLFLVLSAWTTLLGVVLFCGSIYLHVLLQMKGVTMLTPYGGVLLMCGWAFLILAALRRHHH